MKTTSLHDAAKILLQEVRGRSLDTHERLENTSVLAKLIIDMGQKSITTSEKIQEKLLLRLIKCEELKAFVTASVDSIFRTDDPKKVINQLIYLADHYNIVSTLSLLEKFLFSVCKKASFLFPCFFYKAIKKLIRYCTKAVILPGEQQALSILLKEKKQEGIKVNLNRLGEAILGEEDARLRLETVIQDLHNPLVEVVSVKISSLYSQITPLSHESSVEKLKQPLRSLLTECLEGQKKGFHKMLYLDMEEYKDLTITVDLFKDVLSESQFHQLTAGIALQSYIPDSYSAQVELTNWATARVQQGGAPIQIRLVKGANLGMEKVEASIKCWPQAPYKSKADTDANYKKMLHYALDHTDSVHLAIASHNIFDISYALILRSERKLDDTISFEMLEGMCNHLTRVIFSISHSMLVYTPAARDEDFHTAIAYLVRRLDENTQNENFLTHISDIHTEPFAFQVQKSRFEESVLSSTTVSSIPRRCQQEAAVAYSSSTFYNMPDTDWSLLQNRAHLHTVINQWENKSYEIPCVIGSGIVFTKRRASREDPSRPGVIIHNYSLASNNDIIQSLKYASENGDNWRALSNKYKAAHFKRLATLLSQHRTHLTMAIVAECGKIITEADSEVSEAIDFANFYAQIIEDESNFYAGRNSSNKQIVVVATPWNFPCSIAVSSILAPLAAGYSVIFKPSVESILVGFKLVELMYQAGIPKDILQFVCCEDNPEGTFLIDQKSVRAICMTGSTETARFFLKRRPDIKLFAETGGKNTAIVTQMADRDLAVKEIVQSAFGYAGQKCSALSLLILEDEVYYDKRFRNQLIDATESLKVGSSWNVDTKINPLIKPPEGKLLRALTHLDNGQEWLVAPIFDKDNPRLISPSIKFGITKDSFSFSNELFGPVLSVMRAKNLSEAITLANTTSFGLTSGIFSLDPREKKQWATTIETGNCYINRSITGAIVGRQPFGGCKASSFGIGMKAGGVNYLLQFIQDNPLRFVLDLAVIERAKKIVEPFYHLLYTEGEKKLLLNSISSSLYWWDNYFSKTQETDHVVGEDNFLSFKPHNTLLFYGSETDSPLELLLFYLNASICSVDIIWAGSKKIEETLPVQVIDKEGIMHFLENIPFPRIRSFFSPPEELLAHFCNTAFSIDISKPKLDSRLELLHFVREISLTDSYHRYGNLLERAHEIRNPAI